jgi:AcrR family transcriptional regulator
MDNSNPFDSYDGSMDGSKPLRRDAERNRRRILAAADALVAEVGLGVTHNDIARAAEVGVGTVYRRFPDRQELLNELLDERVDRIITLVDEALEIDDPWQGLCAFVAGNLELQASDKGLKDLMAGDGRSTELARRAGRRIAPAVRQLVERAHATGQLRADVGLEDFPLIQEMVCAVMEHSRHIHPDLWRRALALVMDGFRAPGQQREPLPSPMATSDQIEQVLAHSRPRER